MPYYDYVIVGAGPVGLTLAWCLSQYGQKCLLLDREASLGGMHRVRRVKGGLFSEHGPRMYFNHYFALQHVLREMNSDFYDLFVPYDFGITELGGRTLKSLAFYEFFQLSLQYLGMLFDQGAYSKKITVADFMQQKKFSRTSMEYFDGLCRLTDGAAADRYTLFELLQMFNQHFFYQPYQPKLANDQGLFKIWENALKSTGLVEIQLNMELVKLVDAKTIVLRSTLTKESKKLKFDETSRLILAIAPQTLQGLLVGSLVGSFNKNIFGPIEEFSIWAHQSRYLEYISICYYFDPIKIKLPRVWGFPNSPWGVVFAPLSNYMDFGNEVVISTCITKLDHISPVSGKTANQSDRKELVSECFRQLLGAYPNLPNPKHSIVSPGIIRQGDKWIDIDQGFVRTVDGFWSHRQAIDKNYQNWYWCGTFNGNSPYHFTSMESAMTNAFSLVHELIPESTKRYPIHTPFTFGQFLILCIMVMLLLKIRG